MADINSNLFYVSAEFKKNFDIHAIMSDDKASNTTDNEITGTSDAETPVDSEILSKPTKNQVCLLYCPIKVLCTI